ncbi:MAG: hypothetical protein WCX65_06710 [bacterium]
MKSDQTDQENARVNLVDWMMKMVNEDFFPFGDRQKDDFKSRLSDAIQEFLIRVPADILNWLFSKWGKYEFVVIGESVYATCTHYPEEVVKILFYPLSKKLPQPALLYIVAHEIAHSFDEPDGNDTYTIYGHEVDEDEYNTDSRAREWGFEAEYIAFEQYHDKQNSDKIQ